MGPREHSAAPGASRHATLGTLAALAGLLTLCGCDNVDPIEPAAEQAVQQTQDDAVEQVDGTAAGPEPATIQPEPAPARADEEDPQQP